VVSGNDDRKVRIKRALLGNPAALYTATFTNRQSSSYWRYFHWPSNAVNQKLALRLLSQMGYRADVAAHGLEATWEICARWSRG
jgi:CheY-like chemotaxis protein